MAPTVFKVDKQYPNEEKAAVVIPIEEVLEKPLKALTEKQKTNIHSIQCTNKPIDLKSSITDTNGVAFLSPIETKLSRGVAFLSQIETKMPPININNIKTNIKITNNNTSTLEDRMLARIQSVFCSFLKFVEVREHFKTRCMDENQCNEGCLLYTSDAADD